MIDENKIHRGMRVKKTSGYKFPGVVLSVYPKLNGQLRVSVECTSPDCEGMIHIFNLDQLEEDHENVQN